jgi:hypothetical protein
LMIDSPHYLARRLRALLPAACALMYPSMPVKAETGPIKRNY